MVVELAKFKIFRHKIKLMATHFGQHGLTEYQRVEPVVVKIDIVSLANFIDECGIKIRVV